ncbi:TVP38/TMEM64 family protein [Tomitella gaofuii]|uniref:TVP38/TMEM64 family protein n=1 Tax=Tomitella gaofuii TaxID=2760083 RepID=UPI002E2BA79E|nr:TVP38/TMEM64 family protein [Tomitella gaofuii]
MDSPGLERRCARAAPSPAARVRAGLSPRTPAGRRRIAALAFFAAVAVAAAVLGPGLSPDSLVGWSAGAGWWFPVVFVAVHAVVCTAPVPRTAFTVAAGVLFAPLWGVVLALTGSVLAALMTLLAGRSLGRDAVHARLTHPAVRRVDERLRRRGWLAVGSLRLIPVVPFSVLNYCCSVSGVRMLPFLAATVVGSLPGTVAVVYFGHAVSTGGDWTSLALTAAAVGVGVLGLIVDARLDAGAVRSGREGRDPASSSVA